MGIVRQGGVSGKGGPRAENLEQRELLHAVAAELERLASHEGDAVNRRTLLARAKRIRWRGALPAGSDVGPVT